VDYGAALLCAEAVGLMACAKDTTLDYLKTRKQFGSLLSEQQVLQHRMVDLLIHLEQARSMALLAAAYADSDDASQRVHNITAAKALVGEAGRFVGQQSVQLHGAMGLTQECVVSGILKRLTAIDLSCGDTEHHLARLAEWQQQELVA
jgi:alkylation response protein AidB-like acyl-CoA dehydrogenase